MAKSKRSDPDTAALAAYLADALAVAVPSCSTYRAAVADALSAALAAAATSDANSEPHALDTD